MSALDPDHLELPVGEARQRLILALANVARRTGWERLVTQPILEPTPKYFPDAWNRSARGAYRLSRRLLVYAGLDDRDVDLLVFRTTERDVYRSSHGESYPQGPEHTAATYRGTSADAHHFGIEVQRLLEDETLVSSMCHEVAHAFRAAQGLVVTTSKTEEQLTDLTTVYLGFGILTLNGSYRYRTSGRHGAYSTLEWSQATLGYLGAGDMALLLAAQVVARGYDAAEMRRIAAQLEPTQAALFRQAVIELEMDRQGLIEQLGLPPPNTWPAAKATSPFLEPLPPGSDAEYDDSPPREVVAKDTTNQGKSVFRVRLPLTRAVSCLGGVLTLIPAIVLSANDYPEAMWAVPFGFFIGAIIGRGIFRYACSEPSCEASLDKNDVHCARCHGTIRGSIAARDLRLAAEEDLENGVFQSLD